MRGTRDWGLGIRRRRRSRWPMASGQWPVVRKSKISNPQSLIPNPSRSGISLIEVLFSIGVLTVGLFGIAMLIPLGKLALMETEKSDRTGACGRAALRDVDVRRMLDYRYWRDSTGAVVPADAIPTIIAIDPLGYDSIAGGGNLPNALGEAGGAIERCTLNLALPESVFRWSDDLIFTLPEDMTTPVPGDRPVAMGNSQGNFSWFLMVAPSPANALATPSVPVSQRRSYTVSVAVCHKRILAADGERVIQNVTCDSDISYGGVSVTVPGDAVSDTPPLKNNEWVLLYSTGTNVQCSWYRVVYNGYIPDSLDPGDPTKGKTYITLVGPDWYGGTDAEIVIVGGVTGVYTTTVQLGQ